MRLLIGSDAPASLGKQADVRALTQRLLWFAREDDAVVLMDAPDPAFVEYATRLTGVDPSRLRFHILPSRWTGGNFDAWSLLETGFQDEVMADAAAATEVVALWPCPEVGWLVRSLAIEDKLQGAAFWREGGGALVNGKVLFRALAGGAGVPVAAGGVCRSLDDAFRISGYLLHEGHAFVVKRSYGGGGAGNEIVSTQHLALSHAGHASAEQVEATSESLSAYWERRWAWASEDGTEPFVIEAFVPDARTLYVEVVCADSGVGAGKLGELKFESGRVVREVFPAQGVPAQVLDELHLGASRLARAYLAIGYRGRLSLDSVVTPEGRVFFTEANARFTSSTHLYEPIAERVARAAEVPGRVVVQVLSPKSWQLENLGAFLEPLVRHGLAFDPSSRTGVLAVTPVVHGSGQLLMAAIAEGEAAAVELLASVERHFRRTGEGST
ncbi:MAG: peptide ligase PGM1-related protein [Polyangia bacterium]